MKTLFTILVLSIPFFNFSVGDSELPTLKKIIKVSDSEMHYLYKGDQGSRTVIYVVQKGITSLTVLDGKKTILELKKQNGKLLYKTNTAKNLVL
jgi:hypothetical protein